MMIDCHLHLPAFKELQSLIERKQALLNELKRRKIDYAIVIPDNIKGSIIGDVDDCINLFEKQSNIFLMGTLNILKDDKCIYDKMDFLFREEKIVGIKIFPGHDPHYPNDTRLQWVYELCIKYNAPIMIHTGWNLGNSEVAKYNDPKYIVEIAEKYKSLKIVISHYFWPQVEYCYGLTKDYNNIHFDTSGLADEVVQLETGNDKIKRVLERTVNDNPDKVLFGTDYGMCSIEDHIKLIESLDVDYQCKEKIYYRNAMKVFNLVIKNP
ncbi:MAG: amidohydrolase family protein [Planctomycetota bacterium]